MKFDLNKKNNRLGQHNWKSWNSKSLIFSESVTQWCCVFCPASFQVSWSTLATVFITATRRLWPARLRAQRWMASSASRNRRPCHRKRRPSCTTPTMPGKRTMGICKKQKRKKKKASEKKCCVHLNLPRHQSIRVRVFLSRQLPVLPRHCSLLAGGKDLFKKNNFFPQIHKSVTFLF